MENIVLPKLILARIQKYWDKTVPTDYPASDVSFSLKFADAKVKEAVDTFEDALETEDAPIKPFVPERDSASDINMLAVAADPTDKSVTGTVDHVKFEAGKGKYNLYLGNKAAQALTKEDVANDVEYVKISRSATYTIPEADKAVLGDKFIVK